MVNFLQDFACISCKFLWYLEMLYFNYIYVCYVYNACYNYISLMINCVFVNLAVLLQEKSKLIYLVLAREIHVENSYKKFLFLVRLSARIL